MTVASQLCIEWMPCRTTVGKHELSYLVCGDGPPLVLLHGLGETAAGWGRFAASMAERRRLYAIDLFGAGATAVNGGDQSPAFYAQRLAELIESLGLDRPAVVANSLGAAVAVRAAVEQQLPFSAIVLAACAALGPEIHPALRMLSMAGLGDVAALYATSLPGSLQRSLLRADLLFAHADRIPRSWLAEQSQLALRAGFVQSALAALRATVNPMGQTESVLELLPRVHAPTLVVWGKRDRLLPPAHGRKAVERLPRGELLLLDDCGHLPHVEHTRAFAAAVTHFLSRVATP